MRLIDADVIIKALDNALDEAREDGANLMDVLKMELFKNFIKEIINHTPDAESVITYEQVIEYCRKRSLIIVTAELFNEMKARMNAPTQESVGKVLKALDVARERLKEYEDNIR